MEATVTFCFGPLHPAYGRTPPPNTTKPSRIGGRPGGGSISFPHVIVHCGQLLKAMLRHDGFAHRSSFHDREAIAAFTDLLESHGKQTGVQSLPAIFTDRGTGKQGSEVTPGEVRPGDGSGLIRYVGNVHTQITGDLEMVTQPVIDPGIMPTPDLIQHLNDILQPFPRINAANVDRVRL